MLKVFLRNNSVIYSPFTIQFNKLKNQICDSILRSTAISIQTCVFKNNVLSKKISMFRADVSKQKTEEQNFEMLVEQNK